MKAFDGQDIISLYINALKKEQPGISTETVHWHIARDTTISYAQFTSQGFIFRMETNVNKHWPICQYITISCDGEIKFRSSQNWFIPGDVLFDTFYSALNYLEHYEQPVPVQESK